MLCFSVSSAISTVVICLIILKDVSRAENRLPNLGVVNILCYLEHQGIVGWGEKSLENLIRN